MKNRRAVEEYPIRKNPEKKNRRISELTKEAPSTDLTEEDPWFFSYSFFPYLNLYLNLILNSSNYFQSALKLLSK